MSGSFIASSRAGWMTTRGSSGIRASIQPTTFALGSRGNRRRRIGERNDQRVADAHVEDAIALLASPGCRDALTLA